MPRYVPGTPAAAALLGLLIVSAAASDTASFQLSSSPLSAPISSSFLGFSVEIHDAPNVFLVNGLGGTPRGSFVRLMNTLRAAGAASINFRVGGNSADESAWVPAPNSLPINASYRIQQADLDAYKAVLPLWNGTLTLDATLRYAKDPSYLVAHVKAAAATLPELLESIEIGNEVDLFVEKFIRPQGYSFYDYESDFSGAVSALEAAGVSGPVIQGAVWCCHWNVSLWSEYVSAFASSLKTLSYHRYALTDCNGKRVTGAHSFFLLAHSSRLTPYNLCSLTAFAGQVFQRACCRDGAVCSCLRCDRKTLPRR
jgi:hypothetical protein